MTTPNLLEIEANAQKLYGPSPPQEVESFCDFMKNFYLSNPDKITELFESLIKAKNTYFQFWLLDTLTAVLTKDPGRTVTQFSTFINYIATSSLNTITERFIINKLTYLIITFLKYTYPENNPQFFANFIRNIYALTDQTEKFSKINMLLDILLTFDDELIKFRHTYSEFDGQRSTLIKDHIRKNIMNEILNVIFQVISNEAYIDYNLINKCIKVSSQLIDWNLFEWFSKIINEIVTKLIFKKQYMNNSLDLVNAIIKKGMECPQKMQAMNAINVKLIISTIINNENITIQGLEIVSEIINNIGNFLIDQYEDIKLKITLGQTNQAEQQKEVQETNDYTNACLVFICEIFAHRKFEIKTGLQFIDFLTNLIQYFKANTLLLQSNQSLIDNMKKIFLLIEKCLKIPNDFNFSDNFYNMQEEEYFSFRRDFSIIYQNFFSIKLFQMFILDSLFEKSTLINVNSIKATLPEAEHLLFLISVMQNGLHNNDLKDEKISEKFNQILSLLFTIPFANCENDFVLVSYYQTVLKLIQYYLNNQSVIEFLLNLFISDKGVMYPNHAIGVKIVNFFDKFLYKAKNNLKKFCDINEKVKIIIEFVEKLVSTGNFALISEYQLIFQCLSTLISVSSSKEFTIAGIERSLKIFVGFFTNAEYKIDEEKFCEILKCLTKFLNHYNNEINDKDARALFINFFNVFISNYCNAFLTGKKQKILYSIIILLQRTMIMLGKDSLNFMEFFFNPQNAFITVDVYDDSLKLMQNIINTIKKDSIPLVGKTFQFLYNFISTVKLPSDNISDINKSILAMFATFAKLIHTISFEIPELFLMKEALINTNSDVVFSFLFATAIHVIDNQIRRTICRATRVFVSYLKKNNINVEGHLLVIILDGSFSVFRNLNLKDPCDASTFNEIVQIHFNLSFFTQFYSGYLITFMSQNEAEEFYQLINKSLTGKELQVSEGVTTAFKFIVDKNLK